MNFHLQVLIALGLGIKRNGHIFLGLILGIIAGVLLHQYKVLPNGDPNIPVAVLVNVLDVIGKMFIRLIQMVVIPLVCSAIIIGIASVGDSKQLGKMGKKMILYYGLITIAAVVIGAVLSVVFKPGEGVQSYVNHTAAVAAQEKIQEAVATQQNYVDQMLLSPQTNEQATEAMFTANTENPILNLIPQNPIQSIAKGDMIPILIFTLIFAIALSKVGDVSRPIVGFFESVFAATMKVTDWIMYLAAPGVFALTATAVSSFGIGVFNGITTYIIILAVGLLIQLCLVYPLILKIFSKVPAAPFFAAITEPMMVAFGTASSSATLPLTINCCEKRGISHKVCSFVLPLGATLNMDATALFQTVAVIFLTQAYGITLEPSQVVMVAIFAIIASSTSAGIPGAGLITLAIILNALGLTPHQLWEGLAFLFAIDRILDMFRSMLNVTSDAVVAAVIADNEGEFDYEVFKNSEDYKDILD